MSKKKLSAEELAAIYAESVKVVEAVGVPTVKVVEAADPRRCMPVVQRPLVAVKLREKMSADFDQARKLTPDKRATLAESLRRAELRQRRRLAAEKLRYGNGLERSQAAKEMNAAMTHEHRWGKLTPEQRRMRVQNALTGRNAKLTPEQRRNSAAHANAVGCAKISHKQRQEAGRRGAIALNAKLTPEQRSEMARQRQAKLTPEQRSEIARKRAAAQTPEQRSERHRHTWETRRANTVVERERQAHARWAGVIP